MRLNALSGVKGVLRHTDLNLIMNMRSKELRLLVWLTAAVMTLVACGGDDDDNGRNSGNGDNTDKTETNANRNTVTTGVDAAVTRLEFPKLKGGNSIVIVHSTSDSYGINYSLEWDCDKKSQRWSCYEMYKGYTGNAGRYSGDRPQNTLISTYTGNETYPKDPQLNDSYYFDRDYFYGSGYDHGHICPSADRQYSTAANKQTFYLTNMQPQYNKFNAGLWADMEAKVRKLTPSNTTDTLYVCKGGTIDSEGNILTRVQGLMIVPKYFYMALLMKNSEGYKAMAFWAENENVSRSNDELSQYVITIDELERRTGIDFFCNLPDDIEDKVESSVAPKAWGLGN